MKRELTVILSEELLQFLSQNSGPGKPYSSGEDFVYYLLNEAKERSEARAIRSAIIDGYRDAIEGRVVEYQGDLGKLLRTRC